MRALQFVMQEAKTVHDTRISPFLNELKRLSFFGTPLALPPTLPSSSSASSIPSITSTASEGNAKKRIPRSLSLFFSFSIFIFHFLFLETNWKFSATRKNKKKAAAGAKGDEDEGESGLTFQLPKPDLPIYMSENKAYSSSESEFGDDVDDR